MSLESVLDQTTIKPRRQLLSNYLADNPIGELNESEAAHFKHIFSKWYMPDEEDIKFCASHIDKICIVMNSWGKKCFSIYVGDTWHPTSIARLAGEKRSATSNLTKALRHAIEYQIQEYRTSNPLDPHNLCPVTHTMLGLDAQVDHAVPFHILKDDWLRTHASAACVYDYDAMNYVLEEPYAEQWKSYHLEKAMLRWVSKEGNRYAHKLYAGLES